MARFSNIPEKNAKEIVQKWLDYFEISDELRTKTEIIYLLAKEKNSFNSSIN